MHEPAERFLRRKVDRKRDAILVDMAALGRRWISSQARSKSLPIGAASDLRILVRGRPQRGVRRRREDDRACVLLGMELGCAALPGLPESCECLGRRGKLAGGKLAERQGAFFNAAGAALANWVSHANQFSRSSGAFLERPQASIVFNTRGFARVGPRSAVAVLRS